jgi:hypothetical protein
MEARIAADPKLRARAESLRRSYGLLDFLPKPEPSATFTSRTISQAAIKSSPVVPVAHTAAAHASPAPLTATVGVVVESGSTSRSGLGPTPPTRAAGNLAWAASLMIGVVAALGLGYMGAAALRGGGPVAPPVVQDAPVIELLAWKNLPLYAAIDDYATLTKLIALDEFEHSHTDTPASLATVPIPEPDREELIRAFRALPLERQEKIRQFEQSLGALDAPQRDRVFRALETYVAWLYRLPESDRKAILSAPTPEKRLEAIQEVHRTQWVARLPLAQRKQLQNLPGAADRAKLITQWKTEEAQRRESWRLPHVVETAYRTGQPPWPFNDDKLRREVIEFARSTYLTNELIKSRLSPFDVARLQTNLNFAPSDPGPDAVWLGLQLYDYNRIEPSKNLPRYEIYLEPVAGEKPILNFTDLPQAIGKHYDQRAQAHQKLTLHAGKWPDFAVAVAHDLATVKKGPSLLAGLSFGPAKPSQFKPEARGFVHDVLEKQLTSAEATHLKGMEGKWPDYPREMIRLAREHDLSIPGLMLPGSPKRWKETYGTGRSSGSKL